MFILHIIDLISIKIYIHLKKKITFLKKKVYNLNY